MADVTEHRNEQPAPTAPQAATQGPPPGAPRVLQIQQYSKTSQVRQDIMNADVLMFRGDGVLSGLIAVGTNSPYSHAGIVFRSEAEGPLQTPEGPGRLYAIESVGSGIQMKLLSETVAHYHGAVELWRLTPNQQKRFDATKAVAEARRHLGRPYAFSLLFWFVLDWLTLKQFDLRSHTRRRQSIFCSQLVSMAYVRGGVDLCKRYPNAATSPADLISESRLEPVHAFSKQDPLLAAPGPATGSGPAEARPG